MDLLVVLYRFHRPDRFHFSLLHPSWKTYCGTYGLRDFQNSHLLPRPPSQLYAFARVILFLSPGMRNWLICTPLGAKVLYGVPPVSLSTICDGFFNVHLGQSLAGLSVFAAPADCPFAILLGMDGLLCIMKFPKISEYRRQLGIGSSVGSCRRETYFERL